MKRKNTMFYCGFNLLKPRSKALGALSALLLPLLLSAPQVCSAFAPVAGMTYRLESQDTGLCGYADLYSTYPLGLYTFRGNTSEYMIFTSVGGGYYTIGYQDGATVLQDNTGSLQKVAYSGQASQQWSFTETGGGWLAIYNRATGYVLNGNPAATSGRDPFANTAPWASSSPQEWWVDPVYANQQQCIAVAPSYDLAAPKKIVLCSNTNLGPTAAGTLNGTPITFTYWPLASNTPIDPNTQTLWGQYYYTYIDTTLAKSAGNYTVSASGFPDASFTVSKNAYSQIPSATLHQSGVTIGISDIENGFFAWQRETQNEQSMPMYRLVPGGGTPQLVSGTGGPNVSGGWKDATSPDVEMAYNAITLRNLAFAVMDARNSKDAAALLNEVTFGASFFVSGIQNADGSFPIKINPPYMDTSTTPPTAVPPLIFVNVDVGCTAKCVAGLAAAARVLQSSNPTLAAQCLTAAENGFAWIQNNPNNYLDPNIWSPSDLTGSADNILDAAIELAMTTRSSTYITAATNLFYAGTFDANGHWVAQGTAYTNQWSGLHAATALARWTLDPSIDSATRGDVFKQLYSYYAAAFGGINTPFGTNGYLPTGGFGWNPHYVREALTYANLYRAFGLSAMLEKSRDQYNWVAGTNPFNSSFIIGAGSTNILPQFARPRQGSIGELVPGPLAGTSAGAPMIGSTGSNSGYVNGSDYAFGEGGVGDTSYLPAFMMLMDTIVNTPLISTPMSNHTYLITSLNSGQTLDVANASTANGGSIVQNANNGMNSQKWTLVALASGYWKILNVGSQKCLETPNSSTSNSTFLDQNTYTGSYFQQWAIVPCGDGSYELKNRGSGLAADCFYASTAPGASICQYPYYSGNGQRWILSASQNPVNLSAYYNCNGIAADGVPTTSGGLDGSNYTISGNQIGTQQIWNGTTLYLGAVGKNNVVTSTGQTIALPGGNYSVLRVLAEAVYGNAASQPITVQYAAGSPSTFTQSFSDWANPQSYSGETNVLSIYRDNPSGGKDCNIKIYGYTFVLDSTRSVISLTLPNNGNVKILAATLAR
jgi:hypothetical protein